MHRSSWIWLQTLGRGAALLMDGLTLLLSAGRDRRASSFSYDLPSLPKMDRHATPQRRSDHAWATTMAQWHATIEKNGRDPHTGAVRPPQKPL